MEQINEPILSGEMTDKKKYKKNKLKLLLANVSENKSIEKKITVKISRKNLAKIQLLGVDQQELINAVLEDFFERKDVKEKITEFYEQEKEEE